MRLRHTGHLRDVGVVVGMVYHEQIAVADGVGTVVGLTLAVTVRGMAGDAAVAYPGGAKTAAGVLLKGVQVLKEVFTGVEVFFHAAHILHSGGGGRVAGFLGGAELAAGIPLVGTEHVVGLAEGVFFAYQLAKVGVGVVIVATCGEHGQGCGGQCGGLQP